MQLSIYLIAKASSSKPHTFSYPESTLTKAATTMKKAELVFIPTAGISHLVPTVEFAKTLIQNDDSFSVTVLTMDSPFFAIPPSYIDSVTTTSLRFVELKPPGSTAPEMKHSLGGLSEFIEYYKPHAKRVVAELATNSVPITALILDMFTTTMIDLANELGIPSYLYYTSGAAMLGLLLHFPTLDSQMGPTDIQDYPGELHIPSYKNSVPPLALPNGIWKKGSDDYNWFLYHSRRFAETRGIIVNSFTDLEPHAIASFDDDNSSYRKSRPGPRVYPVGPLIDRTGRVSSDRAEDNERIMTWLDQQASGSVVFLCFGSRGTFDADQATEIAIGLERSGHRFLWSLRPRPGSGSTSSRDLVPEGFLERTVDQGLVCGWVPQVRVLGHEAIGCFVSHCGWNSTLESIWFGVPILTWPLYAEQRLNALQVVREMGVGLELRGCERGARDQLTTAEEVERGVRRLMEGEKEVREKAKEMKEKSRRAVMEGGSSVVSTRRLIDNLLAGI